MINTTSKREINKIFVLRFIKLLLNVHSISRTYFVEYQFPVSEASSGKNGASSGTMATEMMRVVSKKVAGKEVSFGHRSVFPVQFDGQAVDRWWKQLLVFKVFSKVAGDKHVSEILRGQPLQNWWKNEIFSYLIFKSI